MNKPISSLTFSAIAFTGVYLYFIPLSIVNISIWDDCESGGVKSTSLTNDLSGLKKKCVLPESENAHLILRSIALGVMDPRHAQLLY
ncbi:hypothetical protein [Runella slithyformis]|uniref:hypothetical protein n=1 Tax=Runella slithyformis TaxID=106 RepID=UPI0002DE3B5C|nr:hypothetical protein [Runella slithyformis]